MAVRIDIITVSDKGTVHAYWSTHCRHGNHADCSADTLRGEGLDLSGLPVRVRRKPAQCKTCASPCVCPCHREVAP